MEKEVWKAIPGYEGLYEVSSEGRVKGLKRGKLLSSTNERGYIRFYLSKENKSKAIRAHQLVAMAFLGHEPDGTHKVVVDHINNNRADNRVANLQLTTNRHNASKDRSGYSSKYVGVVWDKKINKWQSKITIDYKTIHLGVFFNEERAAEIYQLALQNLDLYNGDAKEFRDSITSL